MRSYRSLIGVCVGVLLASSMAFASPHQEGRQRSYDSVYSQVVKVAEQVTVVLKSERASDERPDVINKVGVAIASPIATSSGIDQRYSFVLAQTAGAIDVGDEASLLVMLKRPESSESLATSDLVIGQQILVTADERMSGSNYENLMIG